MNKNTSQVVLEVIKEQNIKPKSRIYFLAHHAILWVPGILVTVIGSFAVAGILFAATHAGFEYREFVYSTTLDFVIDTIPFMWIISYAFFVALIVYALRTTHTGYRLSIYTILFGSFSVSLLLGFVIYSLDTFMKVDSLVRYPVHIREERNWQFNGEGRLAGKIIDSDEKSLILVDGKEEEWVVDISGFNSNLPPFVKEDNNIRIVGTSTNDHFFVACAFFPWEIGGFPNNKNLKMKMQATSTNGIRPPLNFPQNENPDCKDVLESLKKRVQKPQI